MPIRDEDLERPENSFLAVRGEATVGQAVALWQAHGGEVWWHLLVPSAAQGWRTTTFAQLYEAVCTLPEAADLPLDTLPHLRAIPFVERETLSAAQAREIARAHPARLVAVGASGHLAGVLFVATRAAPPALPVGRLNELAGKYVNLKEYGVLLIASSKPAQPPAQLPAPKK